MVRTNVGRQMNRRNFLLTIGTLFIILVARWGWGQWSPPEIITGGGRAVFPYPSIALGPDDVVHLVWSEQMTDDQISDSLFYTKYRPRDLG